MFGHETQNDGQNLWMCFKPHLCPESRPLKLPYVGLKYGRGIAGRNGKIVFTQTI